VSRGNADPTEKTVFREVFRARGAAFLLSQVGAHSSKRWADRLAALGVDARRVMLLWHVALSEGRSQRELADALSLPESRIVGLVDFLEHQGWVERRTSPEDRRARRLYITDSGHELFNRIMQVAGEHETDMTDDLDADDRRRLIEILERIASKQGLRSGVHPDF
jgi:DNA-binding MarR family transcriptional regulator